MMEIWRGRALWRGYIHPHPHPIPNWKNRGFSIPIPIPIPSQCGNFPSKRRRVRIILTGTDLFAISIENHKTRTKINTLYYLLFIRLSDIY